MIQINGKYKQNAASHAKVGAVKLQSAEPMDFVKELRARCRASRQLWVFSGHRVFVKIRHKEKDHDGNNQCYHFDPSLCV